MQNNDTARIRLGPKTLLWAAAILIVGLALYLSFFTSKTGGNTTLVVPNSTNKFALRVADTPLLRSKGLGGTESLPSNQGMVFVFKTPNHACMWMKDMKYPIDIIWLDANKKVVSVSANIQPSTYPEQNFCSYAKKASYVIELNAGAIEDNRIGLGQTLKF